jgi:hypothetical protein
MPAPLQNASESRQQVVVASDLKPSKAAFNSAPAGGQQQQQQQDLLHSTPQANPTAEPAAAHAAAEALDTPEAHPASNAGKAGRPRHHQQPKEQQPQQHQQQQMASQPSSLSAGYSPASNKTAAADFSLDVPAVISEAVSDSDAISHSVDLTEAHLSSMSGSESEEVLLDSYDQPQDFVETLYAPVLEFQLANETAVLAAAQQRMAANGTSADELLLTPISMAMQPLQPATNYVWALAATAELLDDDAEQPTTAAATPAAAAAAGRRLLANLPDSKPTPAAARRPGSRGAVASRRIIPARQQGPSSVQQQQAMLRAQQQQQQQQQPDPADAHTAASDSSSAGKDTASSNTMVPPPLYLVRGVLSFGGPIGPMGQEMDVAVEFDRQLYEFVVRAADSRPIDGDGVVCGNC